MKGFFQFLGTGASAGVPLIGCKCPVCLSTSSKNKRFRPSGILQIGGKTLLIDITPDFRSQALQFHVDTIDGLLLTHTHYDHIAGIDEVRIFNVRQKKPLPCLLSKESFEEIQKRYYYFFTKELSAKLDFTVLEEEMGVKEFMGIQIGYCSFSQGGMKVTGFRVGEFAYITDLRNFDDSIFKALHGVKKLVVSALNVDATPFHLSLQEAVQFADRVGAVEAWITHIGHFLDHDAINERLPSHVRMGYDGLKLEFLCTN
jgi:phosphoribosyl 1,2-cyclic phosphate phosphodiesterase